MATHNNLGAAGESLAVNYLEKNGYTILARNFRFQKAEIDIIAAVSDTLWVIVEVKTRQSNYFGDPHTFLRRSQIKNLVHAADAFAKKKDFKGEFRFDIIAVLKNKQETAITHYENAFYHF